MIPSIYYKQGVFPIKNKWKYKGKLPCVYRSSQEYMIQKWMDLNENVIEWNSESNVIWYTRSSDGKRHRYFPDFSCTFKNKDGTTTKYLLEYKPKKFTIKPVKTKRMAEKTYISLCKTWVMNQEKWKAANEYAKAHNQKFMVLTEESIGLTADK